MDDVNMDYDEKRDCVNNKTQNKTKNIDIRIRKHTDHTT